MSLKCEGSVTKFEDWRSDVLEEQPPTCSVKLDPPSKKELERKKCTSYHQEKSVPSKKELGNKI